MLNKLEVIREDIFDSYIIGLIGYTRERNII